MNKWTRIIATSTASVALAGTALLGATGSASAAPRPAGQDRQDVTISTARDTGADRHTGHDLRWNGDRDRHHYGNDHYGVEYWRGHDGRLYRYDGHRLARWDHGRWVTVWQSYGHGPVR
ncbi:hypothetical protein [Streptomyces sp. NPDC026673]|uniref:hypothetical protein n=1 Tax=Streptomyces sp. NPDC026673 TaxID=3155724 RepID=UPI00341083BC